MRCRTRSRIRRSTSPAPPARQRRAPGRGRLSATRDAAGVRRLHAAIQLPPPRRPPRAWWCSSQAPRSEISTRRGSRLLGPCARPWADGGGALIGIDLRQGPRDPRARVQRCGRRHGRIQPEPARPAQPRARGGFRPGSFRHRAVFTRERAHRDQPRQPPRAGVHVAGARSTFSAGEAIRSSTATSTPMPASATYCSRQGWRWRHPGNADDPAYGLRLLRPSP